MGATTINLQYFFLLVFKSPYIVKTCTVLLSQFILVSKKLKAETFRVVKFKGRYAADRPEATLHSLLICLQITTCNQLDDCLSFILPYFIFKPLLKP